GVGTGDLESRVRHERTRVVRIRYVEDKGIDRTLYDVDLVAIIGNAEGVGQNHNGWRRHDASLPHSSVDRPEPSSRRSDHPEATVPQSAVLSACSLRTRSFGYLPQAHASCGCNIVEGGRRTDLCLTTPRQVRNGY